MTEELQKPPSSNREQLVGIIAAAAVIAVCLIGRTYWVRKPAGASRFSPGATAIAHTRPSTPQAAYLTLVLATQIGCHWCEASVPYYKTLLARYSRVPLHVISVTPQTVDQQRQYLKKLNLPIEDVRQDSFADLGIRGTPTVFLLDGKGAVLCGWEGALNSTDQRDVDRCVERGLGSLAR